VHALSVDGPGGSLGQCAAMGTRFHLTFPENLIQRPVIYELGRRFDVVTNIRRANVEERFGWVILELEGEEPAITDAIAWLVEQGVQVDRLSDSLGS
jgi:ABC-type methionine transport system ATPase subunit